MRIGERRLEQAASADADYFPSPGALPATLFRPELIKMDRVRNLRCCAKNHSFFSSKPDSNSSDRHHEAAQRAYL
jgi:hypothetical protein